MEKDDDGTAAMLELRRSRAYWRLGVAAGIAALAAWWIRRGLAEGGDAAMVWGPGGAALAIAAIAAVSGVILLAKRGPGD